MFILVWNLLWAGYGYINLWTALNTVKGCKLSRLWYSSLYDTVNNTILLKSDLILEKVEIAAPI